MSPPRWGADAAVGVTQALAVLLVHLCRGCGGQLTVGTCTLATETLVIYVPGGQLFRLSFFSLPPSTPSIIYLFQRSPTRHIFQEHVLCARHREHYD